MAETVLATVEDESNKKTGIERWLNREQKYQIGEHIRDPLGQPMAKT